MNIFRFLGDASHFAAIVILLLKIWKTRSCAGKYFFCLHISVGLSGKSQITFALVFTARYLDIFTNYISMYNTIAKVVFIVSSYATIYLMYKKFKATNDTNHDTFRLEYLLIPCGVLALIFNHRFTLIEVKQSSITYVSRFFGRFQYIWKP